MGLFLDVLVRAIAVIFGPRAQGNADQPACAAVQPTPFKLACSHLLGEAFNGSDVLTGALGPLPPIVKEIRHAGAGSGVQLATLLQPLTERVFAVEVFFGGRDNAGR